MHPRDVPADMLPWSAEAESGVLGALMMNPGAWDHVGDILEQKHFFDDRNGRVFSAISGLVLSGKPADVISVHSALETSGQLEGIDLLFLNDMTQVVTGSRNIRAHAEIVAERALLRGLLEASGEIMDLALSTGTPVADRLEQAQSKLQALQINRGRQLPVHVGELVVPLMDRLQSLSDGTAQPGISTGIPGLDRRLNGGLRPGKQMVLAARPSVGKSALALQLCLNLARAGYPAAFFSQEMPNSDNMDRVVANIGSVLLDNLLSGRLRDEEWSRCSGAAEDLSKLPLYFDDQPAMTLQDITVKARALVRTHGIKLLVIDYIQLCASRSGADKRHHQIEEISRGLKSLAKQLGITILTLSQLGRVVESRAGGKPQLSDLKESGSIEEDADIVILLSRDHVVPNGPAVIEADFVKNRQGRIGSVALAFDGGYQRWSDSTEPLGQRGKTPGGFGPKPIPYTEDF